MTQVQEAITGDIFTQPKEVNEEIYTTLYNFYKAFNTRDFALMEQNWFNHEEIAMDNPLGGIKRGWSEIESIYKRIFSGQAKVYVEFYDYTIIEMEGGFCCVGRERGSVTVGDKTIELAIRTSRVYKKVKVGGDTEYKQVHHHGSIEDAKLLEAYQTLVK